MSVWLQLIRIGKLHEVMSLSMEEWLFANVANTGQFVVDPYNWECLFGALSWYQEHIDQESVVYIAHRLCGERVVAS